MESKWLTVVLDPWLGMGVLTVLVDRDVVTPFSPHEIVVLQSLQPYTDLSVFLRIYIYKYGLRKLIQFIWK